MKLPQYDTSYNIVFTFYTSDNIKDFDKTYILILHFLKTFKIFFVNFSDIIKSTQAEHAKKMLKLDQHLLVVHEELAKSIHIIDKHSLEMDDLATRITNIQVSIGKKHTL